MQFLKKIFLDIQAVPKLTPILDTHFSQGCVDKSLDPLGYPHSKDFFIREHRRLRKGNSVCVCVCDTSQDTTTTTTTTTTNATTTSSQYLNS